MRLSTAVALALTLLLAALTVGTVAVPAMAVAPAPDGSPALSAEQPSPALESPTQDDYDPERADTWQEIRLNVTDDGDVRWTIESRFVVADNETEEFEAFAEAVAAGERSVGYDTDQYSRFLTEAERATDREMALEDDRWDEPRFESIDGDDGEDEADRQLGVISYSFTWTNFAVVDGDRIRFGDAFVTDADTGDVWLSSLDDGQRLVVEAPSNYAFDTTPRGTSGGTVEYEGKTTLEAEDFQMVFLRSGTNGSGGTNGEPTSPSDDWPVSAAQAVLGFAGFVVVLVLVSLTISRYQRSAWPFDELGDDGSTPSPNRPPAAETDGSGASTTPPSSDLTSVEHEFDETDDVEGMGSAGEEIDPDLLSDEERVRRMLEENGGRMKQATIVSETGWSDAKVSQLLSEMDDNDEIQKLRIGRENLITLPNVDPTET